MELTDFLLARIARDEEAAEAAARHWHDDCLDAPVAQVELHAYRHDPARVLAESDAKRRIVTEVVEEIDSLTSDWADATDATPFTVDYPSAKLLRLLALPYADHPDYREEWRP